MRPRWSKTLTRRDTETVQAYAEWLKGIQWQLFATFSFAWRVADAQADDVFKAFINELERLVRSPIAFVRGDERRKAGYGLSESGRHYHALLTSRVTLDPITIARIWRRYGGSGNDQDSAKVDSYNSELPGAEYSLKFINQTEGDWTFRNLDLFLPGHVPHGNNNRARRRAARNGIRVSPDDKP
jgi:hypothetical protein